MNVLSIILESTMVGLQLMILAILLKTRVEKKEIPQEEVDEYLLEVTRNGEKAEPLDQVEPTLYKKHSFKRKHHNKNFLNGELIQAINFLYHHRGMTHAEIAKMLGTSKTTVWRYVDHGIAKGEAPKNTEDSSHE